MCSLPIYLTVAQDAAQTAARYDRELAAAQAAAGAELAAERGRRQAAEHELAQLRAGAGAERSVCGGRGRSWAATLGLVDSDGEAEVPPRCPLFWQTSGCLPHQACKRNILLYACHRTLALHRSALGVRSRGLCA